MNNKNGGRTELYSKSEGVRGWKMYEYRGLEICIVVVVVLSPVGTVTLIVEDITLSGSTEAPLGWRAAQSQYGIRKDTAACA